MNQDQVNEIIVAINNLDSRLKKIESKLNVQEEHRPRPEPKPVEKEIPPVPKGEPSNLLGIAGVGCLIVAMILLIKFSIDSGWLTPARQLILATLFGGTLITFPFFTKIKDKEYLSLLPAAGIVVLHLTVYGGVYVHGLINPFVASACIWGIGGLSLWLLSKFNEDLYAILAIAGTYVGAFLVKETANDLAGVAAHLIIWDVIFVNYAIKLVRRSLISLTAYFALGLVCFFGFSASDVYLELATIQFIQMIIIMAGTANYSIKLQSPLKSSEVDQLLPVFVFFYGVEYFYLSQYNQNFATAFSIGFSILLLASYLMTRKRVDNISDKSSDSILGLSTMMLFHSIYIIQLDDLGKVIFGFLLLITLGLNSKSLFISPFKYVTAICGLAVAYSMILIVLSDNLNSNVLIFMPLMYGGTLFLGYMKKAPQPTLAIANIMMVIGLLRLKNLIGDIFVGPICVFYAFALLALAYKRNDKFMAGSSLPVVFFAIGHFLFFIFGQLSQGERIISLIAMGIIVYAGGFIYRKINQGKMT